MCPKLTVYVPRYGSYIPGNECENDVYNVVFNAARAESYEGSRVNLAGFESGLHQISSDEYDIGNWAFFFSRLNFENRL